MRQVVRAVVLAAVVGGSGCPGGGGTLEEEGPSFSTPRSSVPAELAGEWFVGDLASIHYYDRVTGSWARPNGSGFYFIFNEEGLYEHGAVINSTYYGCTMTLQGSERGTAVVSGDRLTLYRNNGRTNVTNNCGQSGENELEPETVESTWRIEYDEYGTQWLVIRSGEVEDRFRPWE